MFKKRKEKYNNGFSHHKDALKFEEHWWTHSEHVSFLKKKYLKKFYWIL